MMNMILPIAASVLGDLLSSKESVEPGSPEEDELRQLADELFDWLKRVVKASATQWDDRIALPIIERLERSFGDPSD